MMKTLLIYLLTFHFVSAQLDSTKKMEPTNDKKITSPYSLTEAQLTTTASGLKYQIIETGTGKVPVKGQQITVHYRGTLYPSGTQFDSSFESGEPIDFPVGKGVV